MGMFDSLNDAEGVEWQTKAFDCDLDRWTIGDRIATDEDYPATYQVEVIGGVPWNALATIRDGVLVAVPTERDKSLPLVGYHGGIQESAVTGP